MNRKADIDEADGGRLVVVPLGVLVPDVVGEVEGAVEDG